MTKFTNKLPNNLSRALQDQVGIDLKNMLSNVLDNCKILLGDSKGSIDNYYKIINFAYSVESRQYDIDEAVGRMVKFKLNNLGEQGAIAAEAVQEAAKILHSNAHTLNKFLHNDNEVLKSLGYAIEGADQDAQHKLLKSVSHFAQQTMHKFLSDLHKTTELGDALAKLNPAHKDSFIAPEAKSSGASISI